MQLFRLFLLFALVLTALLAIPAGVVLWDAGARLREVRDAEVVLTRLQQLSTQLRAVHERQYAALRGHSDARPEPLPGRCTAAAAVVPTAAGGAGLPADLPATAPALLQQAEQEVAAVRLPPPLVLPVIAWLDLLRSLDYAARERELAWQLAQGGSEATLATLFELCGLAVRLDDVLQRRLVRELPPALSLATASIVHGVSAPEPGKCAQAGDDAALASRHMTAAARHAALLTVERQYGQWISDQAQQLLLQAWLRGFVIVCAGGAALLAMSLFGFGVLRFHARPVLSLSRVLHALRQDATATARAAAGGSGEMAALGSSINELVDRWQAHDHYHRLADSVFEHALDGILVTDAAGVIQAVNPALGRMMAYPGRALMYRNVRLFKSGCHDAEFYRSMWQAISQQGQWSGEIWNRRGDGELALLRLSIAAVRDAAGELLHYVGIYSDVTEQRRAEEALHRAHDYQRTILAALGEGLYCVDGEGFLRFLNPAAERMLGWRESELLGRNAHDAFHGKRPDGTPLPRSECALLGVFRDGASYHGEEMFTRRDGRSFPVECHSTPLYENGTITGAVVAFTDISRRKEDEQRILHLAYHDGLTGLANRSFLLQHLRLLIAQGHRHPMPLAVLFLDLDRFKQVNDSLGHHIGDTLLMQVAARLRGVLRSGDMLARQGGDEFIVVCSAEPDGGAVCPAALRVAAKIHAVLGQPFSIDGQELFIGASIGISCLPEHGIDADILLRRADQAMYQAKQAGLDTAIYTPGGERYVQDRLTLETRLRGALARNELRTLVQPVVELASGRIIGGEVLLRWNDQGRLVAPEQFIPLAEETGQIIAIGAWVNAEACRLAAQWRALVPDFVLAVNLSPRQLFDQHLLRDLCSAMGSHGLAGNALELEITETVTMSLPRRARRSIHWLRQRGLRLSIDDFGTGHSSLKRLQEITADRLKIDRSFVQGLPEAGHSVTIVRNTIALAHDLGMEVIAEGVETEAQRRLLAELGCDLVQGFLYSRPVEPEAFTRLLQSGLISPEDGGNTDSTQPQ
ncbi:putative bifunctional diguanylate cyclase/phosphodiesterase [Sulfurivermis fontis]|uniref:putative bifunctional diguanylate cyclase/phosphodiesterase n=1 Tax=Sulfurivermis fontis TaxID=1972068 RepID=UPI000FDA4AD6|nr:bifunctional diguanylate cyclase/phosphodiesterase [Sulfurivermis fontis]